MCAASGAKKQLIVDYLEQSKKAADAKEPIGSTSRWADLSLALSSFMSLYISDQRTNMNRYRAHQKDIQLETDSKEIDGLSKTSLVSDKRGAGAKRQKIQANRYLDMSRFEKVKAGVKFRCRSGSMILHRLAIDLLGPRVQRGQRA